MIALKFNFFIGRERRKRNKKQTNNTTTTRKRKTKAKQDHFFPPWHGIYLGLFAARAIALPLSHGDREG